MKFCSIIFHLRPVLNHEHSIISSMDLKTGLGIRWKSAIVFSDFLHNPVMDLRTQSLERIIIRVNTVGE